MADSMDNDNPDLSSAQTYYNWAVPLPPTTNITNVEGDTTTVVTSINNASGPSITLSAGATGYGFTTSGSTITLAVDNAATVRSSISAAQSGANADINTFSALTGNTGFNAWTGSPDQSSHATFSGTASVIYVQAEMQAVMDSLEHATGLIMALLTALLASGVIEN